MNIVKMSYIEPFIGNTNYKLLFNIKSEVYKCNIQECVELWKNTIDNFYVIFRYQYTNNNNMMPFRMSHKFTDMISIEVIDDGVNSTLYATMLFKDRLTVFHKITMCCGSKSYVLKVEKQLYEYLF